MKLERLIRGSKIYAAAAWYDVNSFLPRLGNPKALILAVMGASAPVVGYEFLRPQQVQADLAPCQVPEPYVVKTEYPPTSPGQTESNITEPSFSNRVVTLIGDQIRIRTPKGEFLAPFLGGGELVITMVLPSKNDQNPVGFDMSAPSGNSIRRDFFVEPALVVTADMIEDLKAYLLKQGVAFQRLQDARVITYDVDNQIIFQDPVRSKQQSLDFIQFRQNHFDQFCVTPTSTSIPPTNTIAPATFTVVPPTKTAPATALSGCPPIREVNGWRPVIGLGAGQYPPPETGEKDEIVFPEIVTPPHEASVFDVAYLRYQPLSGGQFFELKLEGVGHLGMAMKTGGEFGTRSRNFGFKPLINENLEIRGPSHSGDFTQIEKDLTLRELVNRQSFLRGGPINHFTAFIEGADGSFLIIDKKGQDLIDFMNQLGRYKFCDFVPAAFNRFALAW